MWRWRRNGSATAMPICRSGVHGVAGPRRALASRSNAVASTLSYGHQRLLEVAIGLALQPKLLILDEPTQGLAEDEIVGFCELVREIADNATVLLIEHNMQVVMELAHRITVMNNGSILAEGTPAEIRADRRCRRPISAHDACASTTSTATTATCRCCATCRSISRPARCCACWAATAPARPRR